MQYMYITFFSPLNMFYPLPIIVYGFMEIFFAHLKYMVKIKMLNSLWQLKSKVAAKILVVWYLSQGLPLKPLFIKIPKGHFMRFPSQLFLFLLSETKLRICFRGVEVANFADLNSPNLPTQTKNSPVPLPPSPLKNSIFALNFLVLKKILKNYKIKHCLIAMQI